MISFATFGLIGLGLGNRLRYQSYKKFMAEKDFKLKNSQTWKQYKEWYASDKNIEVRNTLRLTATLMVCALIGVIMWSLFGPEMANNNAYQMKNIGLTLAVYASMISSILLLGTIAVQMAPTAKGREILPRPVASGNDSKDPDQNKVPTSTEEGQQGETKPSEIPDDDQTRR